MIFLLVSNVWCLILFQMSALGGLLRQPNWGNLEEAGRLITVFGVLDNLRLVFNIPATNRLQYF